MSAGKTCPQCGTVYEPEQRFCPRDGAALRAPNAASDLVGEVIADRYLITRKLGEGGMGQVYLAEHVRMGRQSAVKVMNPGMVHDADAVSRFNREASNASRINHPNVAAIYDFGETSDGLIYLAMEYVDGEPLTKLIATHGALAPARAGEIVRQAGEALAVAHELGIVHRDLKPDNIMITRNRDGSDCVKVVDFGIAKAASSDAQKVTKTGLVIGTPEFMSPEQLAGDPLDGRSDIYALALVAFNMLTGALPFPSETVQESMIMRLTDRPRTLVEMRADVAWPAEVQLVLDRALARDAKERYTSAAEFGRDLARATATLGAPTEQSSTVVLNTAALPRTRVAPARQPGTTKITTSTPAPRRGGRYAALAASIAVVALAITAGAYATRGRAAAQPMPEMLAAGVPSTSPVSADTTSGDTSASSSEAHETIAPPAASDSTPKQLPAASSARARSSRPQLASADAAARLDEVAGLASREESARRALGMIGALLPQLQSHADSVRALYHKAEAQLWLGDDGAGCATLAAIKRMPRAKYTVSADSLFPLAGCAP